MRTTRVLCALLLTAAGVLAGPATGRAGARPVAPSSLARQGTVPVPRLSDPPAGIHGHPLWDSWHRLKPFGYEQHEYLVSGTARADDGSQPAPYTTRIIVFRPRHQADFNGTVLLDWVNVTAQFENAVDTLEARQMLLREGYAFVHVSAQQAGLCCTPLTPQVWDPQRYAAIDHPGDAYSEDIFAQVAQAMRTTAPRSEDPLAGLRLRTVLAAGQSQSGMRLHGYLSSGQAARDGVIDGFLVHGDSDKVFKAPLHQPVIQLDSDLEADPAPPPADPLYRLWEVAGTAHSDYFIGYQSVHGNGQRYADQPALDKQGYDQLMEAAGNYGQVPDALDATCTVAGATMPMHYATSTAIHDLNTWVRTGQAPASTPRFVFDDAGQRALDQWGNTRGGMRLPPVAVPVATYETTACGLGGITVPFTDAQVQQLYPTFGDYWRQMAAATDRAVRRGWLLRPDARDQMRRACAVRDRYPSAGDCPDYDPPARLPE